MHKIKWRHAGLTLPIVFALTMPVQLNAKPEIEGQTPQVVQQLIDCQTIATDAERLKCYDQRVAAMAKAAQSKDLVIADKNEVRTVRRGLFGFTLPVSKLFNLGGHGESDEVKQVDTTVAKVGHARDGSLKLVFSEGGSWEQTDMRGFALSPRVGDKATITKGAFGSYFVSVAGQPGIKMRRVE